MSAQTIRFPKPMKRGAKVRRGPVAAILQFPKNPTRKELAEEWYWLGKHYKDWDSEELSGTLEDDFDVRFVAAMVSSFIRSDAELRIEIAERKGAIKQRTRTKDFLEQLGVDWNKVRTAEQALFFLVERMNAPELPASA